MRVPREIRFAEFNQPTTSGGTWAGNTELIGGYLVGIRVRPATASTLYDIRLTDKDGYIPFERKQIKGTYQIFMANGPIPIRSILTASLLNSSADETFDVDLLLDP